jgi:apolipoprotein N-acyltransferase
MWATFLYFALFILIQTFWLGESFSRYKQENGLGEAGLSTGVFLGVILSGLAAVIVFFNQFLVKQMRDKMSVQAQPVTEKRAEFENDSNKNNT